jgi:hypothetical protein
MRLSRSRAAPYTPLKCKIKGTEFSAKDLLEKIKKDLSLPSRKTDRVRCAKLPAAYVSRRLDW